MLCIIYSPGVYLFFSFCSKAVLTSTHNECFSHIFFKYQHFFFSMKFSIVTSETILCILQVFVMSTFSCRAITDMMSKTSIWYARLVRNLIV